MTDNDRPSHPGGWDFDDADRVEADFGHAWCPECQLTQRIVDASDESTMERSGERGYWVERLACGHETQTDRGVVGPAPGAPYAGPGVAVAATSHPRDVARARAAQVKLDADPWGPR